MFVVCVFVIEMCVCRFIVIVGCCVFRLRLLCVWLFVVVFSGGVVCSCYCWMCLFVVVVCVCVFYTFVVCILCLLYVVVVCFIL